MSEISDTATLVKLSTEGTYYLIKGSVKGILYLYQTLKKLNAAKVLGNGEVENFEKFLKATEGKYKILNVPTENPEEIARMKSDLDKLHIGYTVLPDLNVGDGQIQVAYAIEDMDKIESWYRSFCLDHLQSGGEKSYRDLVNLTDGQISIVNIPWPDTDAAVERTEDSVQQTKEVLKGENTDFSKGVLPELNKKEKNIPVIVPSYRTEDMKEWYRNYSNSQEELQVQSINEYLGAGMLDEYTYVETADRKNKRILKPELDLSKEVEVTEGERTINELLELPDEKISVAIITEEGKLQKLKADLDSLRINYTILPDLNVGDGYIQIAYATADAPKLKAWYEAYQSDMLAAGTSVEDMKEISLEDYRKTKKNEKPVKNKSKSKNEPKSKSDETENVQKTVTHKPVTHKPLNPKDRNRFNNFEQRDYSTSFFENLEQVSMNKPVDEPKMKTPFEAFLDKKEQQSLSGMNQVEELIAAAVPEKTTVKTAEKTMEQLVEKVLVGPKI